MSNGVLVVLKYCGHVRHDSRFGRHGSAFDIPVETHDEDAKDTNGEMKAGSC